MEKYIFELKMKVRDYECDLQGIVNNANYQHYIEHTRHEFSLLRRRQLRPASPAGHRPRGSPPEHGFSKPR